MTHTSTTRTSPPVEASYKRTFSRRWGNRYRCTACYARGMERAPQFMCHHCGRLFCEECSPRLRAPLSWLFQHQELSALRARGARSWVTDRWWQEAAHCSEHVHYVPRYTSWVFLMVGVAFLAILLLNAAGASPGVTTVLPALLFVAGMGVAFAWRTWDKESRQERFFPVDGEPPTIELEERIEAEAVLDQGSYQEQIRERSPRGALRATVRITEEDRQQLERYEQYHHLSEAAMSSLPVTAGAVVVDNVQRVVHKEMRWNERGEWLAHPDLPAWNGQRSRRWHLQANLARWPALWIPGNSDAMTFTFEYQVDWWVWRQPFKMAFPVQVRAAFPENGERRSVVLQVALTGSVAHLPNPFISRILLERGEALPPFRLLPVQGQKMEGDSTDRLVVQDLKLNEQRVGTLQLQFEQRLDVSKPVWLKGAVMMGAVGGTLSQMEIKGFYDAFGRLREPARREVRSVALLHFRLNLSALPYQARTSASDDAILPGADARRDDLILERLEQASRVVSVHEQAQPVPLNAPQRSALPPIREITGRWSESTLSVPLIYYVKLTPTVNGTDVKIEVEQTDNGDPARSDGPERAVQAIRKLILAPLPRKPAPESSLLGKIRPRQG